MTITLYTLRKSALPKTEGHRFTSCRRRQTFFCLTLSEHLYCFHDRAQNLPSFLLYYQMIEEKDVFLKQNLIENCFHTAFEKVELKFK